MPCRYDGPYDGGDSTAQHELNKLSQLLCTICEAIESRSGHPVRFFSMSVADWWDEHKAADRRRREAEAEARRSEAARDLAEFNRLKKKLGK